MNRKLFLESLSFSVTLFIFSLISLSLPDPIIVLIPWYGLKQAIFGFTVLMFLTFTASIVEQRIIEKINDWIEHPPNATTGQRVIWSIAITILLLAPVSEFFYGLNDGANRLPADYRCPVVIIGSVWFMLAIFYWPIRLLISRFRNRHLFFNAVAEVTSGFTKIRLYCIDNKQILFVLYSWIVRLLLFLLCVIIGWLAYGHFVLNIFDILRLQGTDLLAIVGISFGIYATTQVILRYLAAPTPKIIVVGQFPKSLGPAIELAIPPEANDIQKEYIRRSNSLRQFAALHIEVWIIDIPWYFRPLIQKIAVEGSQIRFKYTRIDTDIETLMVGGNWLYGRWNDNPEPVNKGSFENNVAITNRRLSKLLPSEKPGNIDGYPFTVAFAMKKQGKDQFYHFNDESYKYYEWRNPDWVFDIGSYRVDVRLTGYGLLTPVTRKLKLTNQGSRINDLLIENWPSR